MQSWVGLAFSCFQRRHLRHCFGIVLHFLNLTHILPTLHYTLFLKKHVPSYVFPSFLLLFVQFASLSSLTTWATRAWFLSTLHTTSTNYSKGSILGVLRSP